MVRRTRLNYKLKTNNIRFKERSSVTKSEKRSLETPRLSSVFLVKNGQNTDLNLQNIEFGGTLKARKGPRMNLPWANTNFCVQEY